MKLLDNCFCSAFLQKALARNVGARYIGAMNSLQRIREERAEIVRQRAAIEKRDAELAIAEKVLAELERTAPTAGPETTYELSLTPQAASRRERVIEALSGQKLWMTSAEINQAIARRHGALIKTTSFYPMISLLTKDGVLVRKDDKLALKSRLGEGSQVND